MIKKDSVRLLEPSLINQIAAGEVIERPASAVKELVENALDAGATHIKIILRDGGQSLISVSDNGCGMSAADLELAVERHATSKIPDGDLFHISTLGFRGEALPSIGAVARLHLTSRVIGGTEAWQLKIEGGVKHPLEPAALPTGTKIEVYDLFFATPARLKFLKSPQTELAYAQESLQRLAIAHPHVVFELFEGARKIFHYDVSGETEAEKRLFRLKAILGQDFTTNALPVSAEQEGYVLTGFAALPTFHRANAQSQYFFINGRPVKDKFLTVLVRAVYQDAIPKERYPVVALFLTLPGEEVDINVHPAKIEVRFRNQTLLRGLLMGSLKRALHEAGHRASNTISQTALDAFRPPSFAVGAPAVAPSASSLPLSFSSLQNSARAPLETQTSFRQKAYTSPLFTPLHLAEKAENPPEISPPSHLSAEEAQSSLLAERPLGEALAQIHHSYIVAQTPTGLVLIDQHAAHERLLYEKIKKKFEKESILRQTLLIPEVIDLPPARVELFQKHREDFAQLGLILEPFGENALLVREIPHLLKIEEIKTVLTNLADNLDALSTEKTGKEGLRDLFDILFASLACRSSIKAGKPLAKEEMNALLRQMEVTPHAGQCNHGRPTYVELRLTDIEKLFGRR